MFCEYNITVINLIDLNQCPENYLNHHSWHLPTTNSATDILHGQTMKEMN